MTPAPPGRIWTLEGLDGAYDSPRPGTLAGHRRTRIYGRLDCPSAGRAIARGGYVAHRVFFADADAAIACGYRPCAVCLPAAYARWKAGTPERHGSGPPAGRVHRGAADDDAGAEDGAGGGVRWGC